MYKPRNVKENSHFINAKVVKMMLSAMGKTERQTEEDLGWSTTSLKLYLSYKSKLSNDRLNQLATYLHQDNPSLLINYNPTKKQLKKYQEEQERKNKQKEKAKAEPANNELTSKLLDQLVALIQAVNKLEQTQRNYSDYMTAQLQEIRKSSFKNSEKIDKLTEIDNKHQNYLVGELNKIKLSNHFNR
ncbi:hypothetical protein ACTNET_03885 [Lactobacillus amylovorus]|uniref:hypothetical protein n=1 Tax=Lactobacillus amylovorus TaxID=1604 RepID=UPI003F8A3280